MGIRSDLVGQKFNKLTALSFSHMEKHKSCYVFLCDCGTTKTLIGSEVVSGSITSCGCARAEWIKLAFAGHNRLPFGESAFNALFSVYTHASRRRGFAFELTSEQFKNLTKKNCVYCGVEPRQVCKVKKSSAYMYNGVDRKDNKLGYTVENTCTCCKQCNRAKHSMPIEEFLEWIDRIAKFRTQQNPESPAITQGNEIIP
jgi:5-methylcytosine-specific restriction endonuclease McrA